MEPHRAARPGHWATSHAWPVQSCRPSRLPLGGFILKRGLWHHFKILSLALSDKRNQLLYIYILYTYYWIGVYSYEPCGSIWHNTQQIDPSSEFGRHGPMDIATKGLCHLEEPVHLGRFWSLQAYPRWLVGTSSAMEMQTTPSRLDSSQSALMVAKLPPNDPNPLKSYARLVVIIIIIIIIIINTNNQESRINIIGYGLQSTVYESISL